MINIQGKYYMDQDQYNFILKEYKGDDKEGNPLYKSHGFFRKPEEALESFVNLKVRNTNAKNLKELSDEIRDLKDFFVKQFNK